LHSSTPALELGEVIGDLDRLRQNLVRRQPIGALQFRQEPFVVDGEVATLPLEGDELVATEPGIIKLTVTSNAIAVVEDALSLTSNHGLSRTNPLELHYRKALGEGRGDPDADGRAIAGARRLLASADQGTRIDKRLWTEIAKLTGANSNRSRKYSAITTTSASAIS
jgi:alkylation response protein AidB-like acyl-CoA dehydrogenase